MRAILVALAIVGPFFWFFGEALLLPRSFVFRDAAHYYYPLFEWTSRQWAAGRIPLWNPQENCGVPVLADATSSVLYPGKLVFALPWDYATKYKLYVTGHVLLAAGAAFCLARHWRASPVAAGLCAVSYAFGGSVLFQYANVVFLVGAAWLPLALVAADRMLVGRRVGGALALGAVLALMVLGGDPQGAYHAGGLAGMYALLLRFDRRRRARAAPRALAAGCGADSVPRAVGFWRHRLVLLAIAALGAVALCAVQVLPSIQWARHSGRAAYEVPRSIYEIPGCLARQRPADACGAAARGLFGSPPPGTHHEHIYHFSVGPWRLVEFLWPNISGRLFPIHRRWTRAIPAEGRIWTPSLYMGLLPLLLACACWRIRGGPVHVRWLSWAILFSVVASFGWYGVGWLVQELRHSVFGSPAHDVLIGPPVGGLYWLMVVLLPGYAYFRYPAKLLVVASLGLSVLGARGLDALCWRPPRGLVRALAGMTLLSLLGLMATVAVQPFWAGWMRAAPADRLFGPLDAAGALQDLRRALAHTALVAAGAWWLLWRLRLGGASGSSSVKGTVRIISTLRYPKWSRTTSAQPEAARSGDRPQLILGQAFRKPGLGFVSAAILLGTAFELAVANGWMVPVAPLRYWRAMPYYARQIARQQASRNDNSAFRVYRADRRRWLPRRWARTSSQDRQSEGLRWDVDTLYPKYHLRTGLALVQSNGTLASYDFQAVFQVARRRGTCRIDGVWEPHPAVLDALGARYAIAPCSFGFGDMQPILRPEPDGAPENSALWFNPNALPRAWIVHEIVRLPRLRSRDREAINARTERVLFPDGRARDLRRMAVVETDAPVTLPGRADGWENDGPRAAPERCDIVLSETQHVVIDVALDRAGVIVLSDLYYPGWVAEVERAGGGSRTRVPILRTNRIMRGIVLPSGRYRVTFSYRPTVFYRGAVISSLAWIVLGAVVALRLRNRVGPVGTKNGTKTP